MKNLDQLLLLAPAIYQTSAAAYWFHVLLR